MILFDIMDAYLTVYVHTDDHCYLTFYHNGKLLKYICLPFGLTSKSQFFSKLIKVVVATLHKMGYNLFLPRWWMAKRRHLQWMPHCMSGYIYLTAWTWFPSQWQEIIAHSITMPGSFRSHYRLSEHDCFYAKKQRTKDICTLPWTAWMWHLYNPFPSRCDR